MPRVHHVCRLATLEDLRKSAPIWGQDRALFDSDVWARIPKLLEELLQNGLIRIAYIESLPRGEPRLVGGISFIHPEYIDEACATRSTLPNTVFRAALERRIPLGLFIEIFFWQLQIMSKTRMKRLASARDSLVDEQVALAQQMLKLVRGSLARLLRQKRLSAANTSRMFTAATRALQAAFDLSALL
jgi:hypothetical protein